MNQLSAYIKNLVDIRDEDLNVILSGFKKRKLPKGRHVLKRGQQATAYFFIHSGGLRIYLNNKEKEITTWVALENEFFTDILSAKNKTPSEFNIQAIEDTELLTISCKKMEEFYKTFPKWQEFGRKVWEMAFLGILEGVIGYQSLTSEERYLKLMKQSSLLTRIPLKDLSTYLGITPTSLSRLRKKIK